MTGSDSSLLIAGAQFIGLALLVVGVTRYLLLAGIEEGGRAWGVPAKIEGQILGYATSVPELVGTVATAARGLLGAGLWNVAASNIINWLLFGAAVLYYRRGSAVFRRVYLGEIGFAATAVAVPLVLSRQGAWSRTPMVALALLGFFLLYQVADRVISARLADVGEAADEASAPGPDQQGASGLRAVIFMLLGLVGIVVIGHFLGGVAERIVVALDVPQFAVGWILGLVTSLPEMTTFFAVFAAAKGEPTAQGAAQRSLDNLAASNMSNVGLVYPIGILIFVYVAG